MTASAASVVRLDPDVRRQVDAPRCAERCAAEGQPLVEVVSRRKRDFCACGGGVEIRLWPSAARATMYAATPVALISIAAFVYWLRKRFPPV